MDIATLYNDPVNDASKIFDAVIEEKKRAPRAKKAKAVKAVVEAKAPRRVGRPRKADGPNASPRKLPKTKLLSVVFRGDSAELTFRDLRKLKTPLKYMDKRLSRLTPKELRCGEVSKNGKNISWADRGIRVEVASVLHFEG